MNEVEGYTDAFETKLRDKLSSLDRYLLIWIILSMIFGFILGHFEGIVDIFTAVQFG